MFIVGIDTGGTFTDLTAVDAGTSPGKERIHRWEEAMNDQPLQSRLYDAEDAFEANGLFQDSGWTTPSTRWSRPVLRRCGPTTPMRLHGSLVSRHGIK